MTNIFRKHSLNKSNFIELYIVEQFNALLVI